MTLLKDGIYDNKDFDVLCDLLFASQNVLFCSGTVSNLFDRACPDIPHYYHCLSEIARSRPPID